MPNGKRRARPHLDPRRPPARREIKIYVAPELVAAIEEEADAAGMSRSAWIEAVIMSVLYEPAEQDQEGGPTP